mgnify:CR=1 FL=1
MTLSCKSPSSRRAWIEIKEWRKTEQDEWVALLAEGVDRNFCFALWLAVRNAVALLAEGVDRNWL